MHLDLPSLIGFLGYPGLALIVFAESGFLLGAILPGDSLLFTAGIFAAQGIFSLWLTLAIVILAAILGDSFGYWTGKKFGRRLFIRDESLFFRKEYADRTEEFYKKHGRKTLILARFIPIVRTFAPIFAGIGSMEYSEFLAYNAIGGTLWGAAVILSGYFLGAAFPQIENYLTYIILAIVFISLLPVLREYIQHRKKREEEKKL